MTRVFVFGSNLAGRHGKGAALAARQKRGAQLGVGRGRTGNAYAIPTKGMQMETLPLYFIQMYVDEFVLYARAHPGLIFDVTAIGTGYAGYAARQIAPMFRDAPVNCVLPRAFLAVKASDAAAHQDDDQDDDQDQADA